LTPPREGRISFNGNELTGKPTHRIIATGIACIPEGRKVFPRMTVEENLRIGAYQEPSKVFVKQRMQKVFEIFPRLQERRRQLAGTMSGGEQAMISIGRGLMSNPQLLIIDEPSLGLAPTLVNENFKIIERINQQGITVFLVEQNVRQTLEIAAYGYVLSKGQVVAEGSASTLKNNIEVNRAYFG
jgi:branched-chain amino acid transport system ATP-binding protein